MHDPRLGRFFAVDPLFRKYPFYSPYAFSGNRVIDAVELEGLEPHAVADGQTVNGPYENADVAASAALDGDASVNLNEFEVLGSSKPEENSELVEDRAQSKPQGQVEEIRGVSVEFEIAFPDFVVGDLFGGKNGIGIEFGLLNDGNSLNLFGTTKHTSESSAAFGVDVGLFIVTPNLFVTHSIRNNDLHGKGFEQGINLGIAGLSLGGSDTYNYTAPSKYILIRPSVGVGFEIGVPLWITNTTVIE